MLKEKNIDESVSRESEETIISRMHAERETAETWEEFNEFKKDLKFKIKKEIKKVTDKGARGIEDVPIINSSLGLSLEKLEEIKSRRKSEISEINPGVIQLGENVQVKIIAQIEKSEKMYAEFAEKIKEIEQKIDKILLDTETDLRGDRIREVQGEINKIKEIHE